MKYGFSFATPAVSVLVLSTLLAGCASLSPLREGGGATVASAAPGAASGEPGADERSSRDSASTESNASSPSSSSTPTEPEAARAQAVQQITRSPWGRHVPGARWEHFGVPGKQATRFRYEVVDGRHAVAADARSSASLLRKHLRVEPAGLGRIRFSWKVPSLIEGADMALRDKDDSPVRIVLAFDGDRSRFSPRDMLLAELSRAITGEEMPYATLMYVWSNSSPAGSVITNPRTDRVRKLVLESGPGSLGRWVDYERDIRADYQRAFGEGPGALVGVAIMTDSDNTRSHAKAWYGVVSLQPGGSPAVVQSGR